MRFYNREKELLLLQNIVSSPQSSLTYLLGRRRIGKTYLIEHFFRTQGQSYLYFFVGNKKEGNLLQSFNDTLSSFLGYPMKCQTLREFFQFLFAYGSQHPGLCVVLDEFQNFFLINEGIYSDIQEFRDAYKNTSQIHIFALGSIYTLMQKVFLDKGSPLFGRATHQLHLQPFGAHIIHEILVDYHAYTPSNLLDIYTLFGGIPKYLEVMDRLQGPYTLHSMLTTQYIHEYSLFLSEGEDLLITEFGKTAPVYFSILESIANGKNKRSEIADYTGISYDSLGLYLDQLEKTYTYITKMTPVIMPKITLNKYAIADQFLLFWFRYIYKKSYLLQIGKYTELIDFIMNDITILQGYSFEKLVQELLIKKNQQGRYTISFDYIGSYRDKGDNEIDIVCFSERSKEVVFIECKLQAKSITPSIQEKLIAKSLTIPKFTEYTKYYEYYSKDDIDMLLDI